MSGPRTTHLITSLDADGAQRTLVRLLAQLGDRAQNMEVISLRPLLGVADQLGSLGVSVRSLGMSRLGMSRLAAAGWASMRLVAWLRRRRPDVLVTWLYHANLLGTLAAPLAGRLPLVWNIRHTKLDPSDRLLTRSVARACAKLSQAPKRIVFCSQPSQQWHVSRGYPAASSVVVPNGFDLDEFAPSTQAREQVRQELGLASHTRLLGHIGRFHADKDHRTFVDAARQVAAVDHEAHFVLCGRGVDAANRELNRWIESAGITSRCHLLGPRADVPRVTAALDLLVCSSATESFPNVLGEALACGIPCATTDVGDAARIVGQCGRVAPPQNGTALADACLDLLFLSAPARRRLAVRARAHIRKHFDLTHTSSHHYEGWCRAAGKSPPRWAEWLRPAA